MTGLVTAGPHHSMIDLFARRSKVATRVIGIADVLTPVQVRVFSDCEMRWFYEHLLVVPDPPTASMALALAEAAVGRAATAPRAASRRSCQLLSSCGDAAAPAACA